MYIFGGHAGALYNAEAVKSNIQKSLVSGSVPRIALAAFFVFAGQQAYTDVPAKVFPPKAAAGYQGQTVQPIKQAAPQYVDLNVPPNFTASAQLGGGTPKTLGSFTYAVPQNDSNVARCQIYQSLVAGPTPPVIKQLQASPQQVDLTLQGTFSKPLTQTLVTGPVIPIVRGLQQQIDLTIQPQSWSPLTQQGWLFTVIGAGPDVSEYPLIQGFVTKAISAPSATPQPVAKFLVGYPQIDDRPTRQVYTSQIAGHTPPVLKSFFSSPQYVDLTQQGLHVNPCGYIPLAMYAGGVSGTVGGAYLQLLVPPVIQQFSNAYASQFEERPTRVVWPSVVKGQLPKVIPWFFAQPQQVDLTLQGRVNRPLVQILTGPVLKTQLVGPQLVDLILQPRLFPTAAQHVSIGLTVKPIFFVPAQFDISANGTTSWTPSTFAKGRYKYVFPGAGKILGRFGATPTAAKLFPYPTINADPSGFVILTGPNGSPLLADGTVLMPFYGAGPIKGIFTASRLIGLIISTKINGIFG